jgi:hypothetical protein
LPAAALSKQSVHIELTEAVTALCSPYNALFGLHNIISNIQIV